MKSYWNARAGFRKLNGQPIGWVGSAQTALCFEVQPWHIQRPEKLALKFLKLRQWINDLKSHFQCIKIKCVGVRACQHVSFFCLMVYLDNKQPNSELHPLLSVISSPLAWGISDFFKYKFTSPFLLSMHHPNPVLYTEVSHFSIKKWVTELTCFTSWQWHQKSQVISGSQIEIRGDCFFIFFSPVPRI